MFQYLAPTLAFLLAFTAYGETLSTGHAVSFGCVWTALALFSWDAAQRRPRREGPGPIASDPGALYPGRPDTRPELER
jgi:chloramphenicol-sensitive protein RarD